MKKEDLDVQNVSISNIPYSNILISLEKKSNDIPPSDFLVTAFLKEKLCNDEKKSRWDAAEKMMDKWTFIGSLTFIICFNLFYWCTALM